MAEKVKLSIEVEPELRRRVKLAATSNDETVREWIVSIIQRELDNEGPDELILPPKGVKPKGSASPPRPRSGRSVADAIVEDRDDGAW